MVTSKIGIVICSRSNSKRVPNKPFVELGGKAIIERLVNNLLPTGYPVIVATPPLEEYQKYKTFFGPKRDSGLLFDVFSGSAEDPLKRTLEAAQYYGFDHIIRVCHDKIFVSQRQIEYFVDYYAKNGLDYLYSTNFIDGMSFEIFSREVLERAAEKYKNVEHLSFAIDSCAYNKQDLAHFPLDRKDYTKDLRLLIDYPEDVTMMKRLFANFGSEVGIIDVIAAYRNGHPIFRLNKLPWVTIYTCAYNGSRFIQEAIKSVLGQQGINFEYILIDDASEDDTLAIMGTYADDERVNIVVNRENLGLASSSNIALSRARGKYIIRLDADDYFIDPTSVKDILDYMESIRLDAVYPSNIQNYIDENLGCFEQKGHVMHHAGGTLFRKRALDYLRFTDGLRHFEGKDLYNRAIELKLKIGYYDKPIFFYRQHKKSLSRTKTEERENAKLQIV